MLKKTFVLVLTLTIVYLAESSPITLDYNNLDNFGIDYPELGYARDDQPWVPMNLFKLYEAITGKPAKRLPKASINNAESSAKASESKKKNNTKKGVYSTHSSGDLNSFFNTGDKYDHGDYDDTDEYAEAAEAAAKAAVTKGMETRTYARGNKTTGFHRVHHKDEYKKDQEFYEKDETKGTINKAGAKALGTKVNAGAGIHKGSFKHDRQRGIHGKQGYLDNGFSNKQLFDYVGSEDPAGEFDTLDTQL